MVELDNKKLLITIGVLLVIIFGLGIYIKVGMKGNDTKATKTTIDNVSIDLNAMFQIGDTLDKLDNAFNDSRSKYFGYIYKEKKLDASKFNKEAALYLALYDNLEYTVTGKMIPGAKVKSDFESIFGKNLNYVAKDINAGDYYKIKYDSSKDAYSYTLNDLNEEYYPEYVTINVKTVLEEDKVIVTRRVLYAEYYTDETGMRKATIYKNTNKISKVVDITLKNGEINKKEILAKYGSKFRAYNYIFVQNRRADDYVLTRIQQTK